MTARKEPRIENVDAERVRSLFDYDPTTGILTVKKAFQRRKVGEVINPFYRPLNVDGIRHRVRDRAERFHNQAQYYLRMLEEHSPAPTMSTHSTANHHDFPGDV